MDSINFGREGGQGAIEVIGEEADGRGVVSEDFDLGQQRQSFGDLCADDADGLELVEGTMILRAGEWAAHGEVHHSVADAQNRFAPALLDDRRHEYEPRDDKYGGEDWRYWVAHVTPFQDALEHEVCDH